MVKKILSILAWVVTAAALIALFVFAREDYLTSPVKAINVHIERDNDSGFIKERFLLSDIERFRNTDIGTFRLYDLQNSLNANPWIESNTSYIDLDGTLHVSIKEYNPVLRVFGIDGKSVYLTESGQVLPTNRLYTPYVLIANGNFDIQNDSVSYPLNDTIESHQPLSEALHIWKAIDGNPFMKSCIGQVYRNSKGEFDITVKDVKARVILGDTIQMADKLRRAEIFFKQKVGTTDLLAMKTINFKYKNQVVCTKKTKQ